MPIPHLQTAPKEGSHRYWLPPGVHECTAQEVEEHFVYNRVRQKVWEQFCFYLLRIHDTGGRLNTVYVNGSFVTGRDEPGDVDGVAFVGLDTMEGWLDNTPHFRVLRGLLCETAPRAYFGTDLFIVSDRTELDRKLQTFQKGIDGRGLRNADAQRDPSDLVIPDEKGILCVDFTDHFSQNA